MALRVKTWLAVAASCCVLLAVVLLPPARYGAWPPVYRTTLAAHRRAIAWEVTRQNELYKRFTWVDSVEALVRRSPGLALALPPAMPEETGQSVRALVERVVAQAGHTDMVMGLALLDGSLGSYPGWRQTSIDEQPEYYMGTVDGRRYCVAVVPYPPQGPPRGLARGTPRHDAVSLIMGPCLFQARYGPPGSAIARWLEGGGYAFAYDRAAIDLVRNPPGRGLFGKQLQRAEPSLIADRCVSGNAPACADAILEPDTTRQFRLFVPATRLLMEEGPVTFRMDAATWPRPFFGLSRRLLRDLEAEFGRDRFARFWTSHDDVASAFAAAFGEPPGTWVMGWARARLGTVEAGPGVGWPDLLLTLLGIGAVAAVAVAVVARRAFALHSES